MGTDEIKDEKDSYGERNDFGAVEQWDYVRTFQYVLRDY